MVEITNGIETFTIPEGAVNVYKNMGFSTIGDKSKKVVKTEAPVIEQNEESNDIDFDELLTRPVSQWNQEEIKEFAAAKGIDVSNARSLKQARTIIKEALDAEEKALVEE